MLLYLFLFALTFKLGNGGPFGPPTIKSCIPRDTCTCVNVDGLIDLHPLARNDGTPRFQDIPDPDGKTFYSWNPCYDFDEESCHNVAACQIKDQGRTCTSLGPQSSMMSVSDSALGLIFRFTNWGGLNYSAHVIITCDHSQEGVLSRRPDLDENFDSKNLFLELKSKYACAVKQNTSTTTAPTTQSTKPTKPTTRRTTPAFIGTAKTPRPTAAPLMDINQLGNAMIGVLVMLSVLILLVIALIILHISKQRNYYA